MMSEVILVNLICEGDTVVQANRKGQGSSRACNQRFYWMHGSESTGRASGREESRSKSREVCPTRRHKTREHGVREARGAGLSGEDGSGTGTGLGRGRGRGMVSTRGKQSREEAMGRRRTIDRSVRHTRMAQCFAPSRSCPVPITVPLSVSCETPGESRLWGVVEAEPPAESVSVGVTDTKLNC